MIGDPTGKNVDAPAADARGDRAQRRRPTRDQVFKILDREQDRGAFNSEWMDELGRRRHGQARREVHRGAHARARRLRQALPRRAADRDPRVPLSAGAGLRLGRAARPTSSSAAPTRNSTCSWAASCRSTTGRSRSASSRCRCSKGSTASTRCRSRWATTSASTSRATEMFGKLMSISDELMWRYYRAAVVPLARRHRAAGSRNATAAAIRAMPK